jgi:hypothetical protein
MTSPYNDPQYKANRKQILSDGKATICALCGKAGANTADHIISLMHGGDNSIDNLQPAHQRCNSKKGALEQNRRATLQAQQRQQTTKTDFFIEYCKLFNVYKQLVINYNLTTNLSFPQYLYVNLGEQYNKQVRLKLFVIIPSSNLHTTLTSAGQIAYS